MSTLEIILTILFFVLIIPAAAIVKAVCDAQDIDIDDFKVICAWLFWPVTLCIAIVYILCGWIYDWYCWCYRMFKKLFKI